MFIISAYVCFWGLDRFNGLVFDEVYYARFAVNYLQQQSFFDAHPPLGKYIIAVGICLSQALPFLKQIHNDLTGISLSPFQYRWFNALIGSFIPVIVTGIGYELTKKETYRVIISIFANVVGLFLMESRYGIVNIYYVFCWVSRGAIPTYCY
jgi:dolichyl-phosphate-mannose-protein mannosyltransferase